MFEGLATPALVVDLDVFGANARRMRERALRLGVALRPHAKTVKSPELLAEVAAIGVSGFTVSTMGEVRTLDHLTSDLLYGVPVAPGKARQVLEALGDGAVRLTVVVDDDANLGGVPDDPRVDVAIEIDCDGHRGGIAPDSPGLIPLADRIAASGHRLRGVMTHAGGSYLVTRAEVAEVADRERESVLEASARLRGAGHTLEMVSVGSTPTSTVVTDLVGVSEMRPGVYLFGDLSLAALGACAPSDIAAVTVATVIGRSHGGETALIDAGWTALSQDRGVPALNGSTGLGVVVAEGGDRADPDLIVSDANQEHGFVTRVSGGPTGLRTGERVAVLPNHACATAEMHSQLVLVSGGEVVGRVARPRGW